MKERILLEGVMPQRALNRLVRAGIAVEKVKRRAKNRVEFTVDGTHLEKLFSIYPDIPYNGRVAYTAKRLKKTGISALLEAAATRTGLLLGGLAFIAVTLFADTRIFRVEIDTDTAQRVEISRILTENGITEFAAYDAGKADGVCAQILALDGVSFCSLKKVGSVCKVVVRGSSFAAQYERERALISPREGTLISLTVLRGRALVQTGAPVSIGSVLAVATDEAGNELGFVVARACIACVYEGIYEGEDERLALAEGYLSIGLQDEAVRLLKTETRTEEGKIFVRMEYEYIVSANYT